MIEFIRDPDSIDMPRLRRYARKHAPGADCDDLVQSAVMAFLDGRKPDSVSIDAFLRMQIKGRASSRRRHLRSFPRSSVVDGPDLRSIPDHDLRLAEQKRLSESIAKAVEARDAEAAAILVSWSAGATKRREVCALTGLSVPRFRATIKRLRTILRGPQRSQPGRCPGLDAAVAAGDRNDTQTHE